MCEVSERLNFMAGNCYLLELVKDTSILYAEKYKLASAVTKSSLRIQINPIN